MSFTQTILEEIEQIEQVDKALFLYLNGFHSAPLDSLMFYATKPWVWTPIFLFFIFKITRLQKTTFNRLALFLGFVIVILLSDRISVLAFKEVFLRYRPCHNFDLISQTHIVKQHCGGMYGFLSSHATNFMGIATFASIALELSRPLRLGVFLWAGFVCYTRIYLGVHYPLDILCGSLLGIAIGYTVAKNLKHYFIRSEKFK